MRTSVDSLMDDLRLGNNSGSAGHEEKLKKVFASLQTYLKRHHETIGRLDTAADLKTQQQDSAEFLGKLLHDFYGHQWAEQKGVFQERKWLAPVRGAARMVGSPERQSLLQLPIGNSSKIQEALNLYLSPERLSGENRVQLDSEDASSPHVEADQRLFLMPGADGRLPEQMVLSLRRFERVGNASMKITQAVDVSKEIEIPYYESEADLNKGEEKKVRMRLKAGVVHRGDTPNSGHYYAYVLHRKADGAEVWLRHDDSAVTEVTEEEALRELSGRPREKGTSSSSQGYYFLYERVDAQTQPRSVVGLSRQPPAGRSKDGLIEPEDNGSERSKTPAGRVAGSDGSVGPAELAAEPAELHDGLEHAERGSSDSAASSSPGARRRSSILSTDSGFVRAFSEAGSEVSVGGGSEKKEQDVILPRIEGAVAQAPSAKGSLADQKRAGPPQAPAKPPASTQAPAKPPASTQAPAKPPASTQAPAKSPDLTPLLGTQARYDFSVSLKKGKGKMGGWFGADDYVALDMVPQGNAGKGYRVRSYFSQKNGRVSRLDKYFILNRKKTEWEEERHKTLEIAYDLRGNEWVKVGDEPSIQGDGRHEFSKLKSALESWSAHMVSTASSVTSNAQLKKFYEPIVKGLNERSQTIRAQRSESPAPTDSPVQLKEKFIIKLKRLKKEGVLGTDFDVSSLNPYDGVSKFKKLYIRASLKVHPDKTSNLPEFEREMADEEFKGLSTLYEALAGKGA